MAQKQEPTISLQPLLDVRQNQLNLIFSYAESLDTKNLAILAANIAILLFAAQTRSEISVVLATNIFVVFVVSTLINIVATILFADYMGASVDIDEHPEYLSMAEDDLVLQLLSDTQAAIVHNRKLNRVKFRLCVASVAFSAVGTALLIWGIL